VLLPGVLKSNQVDDVHPWYSMVTRGCDILVRVTFRLIGTCKVKTRRGSAEDMVVSRHRAFALLNLRSVSGTLLCKPPSRGAHESGVSASRHAPPATHLSNLTTLKKAKALFTPEHEFTAARRSDSVPSLSQLSRTFKTSPSERLPGDATRM
jgi:hypothetical protein